MRKCDTRAIRESPLHYSRNRVVGAKHENSCRIAHASHFRTARSRVPPKIRFYHKSLRDACLMREAVQNISAGEPLCSHFFCGALKRHACLLLLVLFFQIKKSTLPRARRERKRDARKMRRFLARTRKNRAKTKTAFSAVIVFHSSILGAVKIPVSRTRCS